MTASDLGAMFLHFAILSLVSVSGGMALVPEMHRFLVESQQWMTGQQFADAITLGQVAPGPNILFVMLLGLQAGGALGALTTSVAIMLPSSLLTFFANRWRSRRLDTRFVRAFRLGLSPIAIGLTVTTGTILARANDHNLPLAMITLVTVLAVLRTRLNPLWLIAGGGLLGLLGAA